MEEFTYYFNGEFVPASQAVIPVSHRGYRLADTVFDTERTFNGEVFRLREHLERLYRSLKVVRVDPGLDLDEMTEVTLETVRRNEPLRQKYGDFWVTQLVSRGAGRNVLEPGPATVTVVVDPLPFWRHSHLYAQGAHLVTTATRRVAPEALDPKIKSTDRLNLVMAEMEAKQVDSDAYPLLLDDQGNLTEIVSGNLLRVSGGVVRTPGPRSILCGVSRQTNMELARSLDIPVVEDNLQAYDMYVADEAFVSTTSFCILPVGKFNGAPVGSQVPGPITRRLTSAWSELVGLDIVEQAQRFA
ncbi:MAG: aminotransferase class IV, partial [Dehalococcoidia bacterium]